MIGRIFNKSSTCFTIPLTLIGVDMFQAMSTKLVEEILRQFYFACSPKKKLGKCNCSVLTLRFTSVCDHFCFCKVACAGDNSKSLFVFLSLLNG